jgi:hypothetical protein
MFGNLFKRLAPAGPETHRNGPPLYSSFSSEAVTIQYGLVLVAKSQEAPEKNRERKKRAFRHLDESLLNSSLFFFSDVRLGFCK